MTHACRSLGRLLRRISSTPARRAVELDDEDNWGLLSENESEQGTTHDNELAHFSPAPMIEDETDPGWVADCTSFFSISFSTEINWKPNRQRTYFIGI